MAGMAVGTGAGIAVLLAFHRPASATDAGTPVIRVSPTPGGASLWVAW
jgi:hypothetical protein